MLVLQMTKMLLTLPEWDFSLAEIGAEKAGSTTEKELGFSILGEGQSNLIPESLGKDSRQRRFSNTASDDIGTAGAAEARPLVLLPIRARRRCRKV